MEEESTDEDYVSYNFLQNADFTEHKPVNNSSNQC